MMIPPAALNLAALFANAKMAEAMQLEDGKRAHRGERGGFRQSQ